MKKSIEVTSANMGLVADRFNRTFPEGCQVMMQHIYHTRSLPTAHARYKQKPIVDLKRGIMSASTLAVHRGIKVHLDQRYRHLKLKCAVLSLRSLNGPGGGNATLQIYLGDRVRFLSNSKIIVEQRYVCAGTCPSGSQKQFAIAERLSN